jgi:hypothetical protein
MLDQPFNNAFARLEAALAAAIKTRPAPKQQRPVDPPKEPVAPLPRVSPPVASRYEELVRELHKRFGLELDQTFSYELLRAYGDRLKGEMKRATTTLDQLRQSLIQHEPTGTVAHGGRAALLERLMELHHAVSALCAVFDWDEEEAFHRAHLSKLSNVNDLGRPEPRKTAHYRAPVLDDLV